jgi:putative phage-type endonuclease
MKIVSLTQGTPEWHAHRAAHFNASDAPAMLGVSPYKSRAELLREHATGVAKEVDATTQRRFDEGHRLEALARPIAEQSIGEDLYPCVGVEGRYSASFDGLTMLYDTAFEHKTLNDTIRSAVFTEPNGVEKIAMDFLHISYRAQMEHQCMVSGAERVLFMASKQAGEEVERYWGWYYPDPDLRARIIAGWEQFAADLEAYKPDPTAAVTASVAVGRAPESLPALRIQFTGMVTESNLTDFKERAVKIFRGIRSELKTDQDFADAEQTVKWCGEIEDKLDLAKSAALAQTESIEALFRAIDEIKDEARAKRLELERLVKARKETIRAEIVERARNSVIAHIGAINATLGEHAIGIPASLTAEIGAAIKGRKTLSSITDAADAAAANAKITASQQAERVRGNIAVLAEFEDYAHLFADRVQLCATKAPDDLRNLAATRVNEERERLQRQAEAKAAADAEMEQIREQAKPGNTVSRDPMDLAYGDVYSSDPWSRPGSPVAAGGDKAQLPCTDGATIRLGEINTLIAPLSVTAEGLASIGINPVGNQRSAKLYAGVDLPHIFNSLTRVLRDASAKVEA